MFETWTLIIVLYGLSVQNPVSIDHVTFKTHEQCTNAAMKFNEIKERENNSAFATPFYKIKTLCVEGGI